MSNTATKERPYVNYGINMIRIGQTKMIKSCYCNTYVATASYEKKTGKLFICEKISDKITRIKRIR